MLCLLFFVTEIELKSYIEGSKVSDCVAIISPIKLKSVEVSATNTPSSIPQEPKDGFPIVSHENLSEWEEHKIILRTLSHQIDQQLWENCKQKDFEKENPSYDSQHREVENLFKVWVSAQMTAISKYVPEQSSVVPIMIENVIQLEQEQTACNVPQNGFRVGSCNKPAEHQIKTHTKTVLFLISLHKSKDNSEKVANGETEMEKVASVAGNGLLLLDIYSIETMENMFRAGLGMIKIGQQRHITTALKNSVEDKKGPSLGSLTWLKEPASEILNSKYILLKVFCSSISVSSLAFSVVIYLLCIHAWGPFEGLQVSLSTEAQATCRKLRLPSPGYVLLHGPPVSFCNFNPFLNIFVLFKISACV